jgi:hypothetical protein
LRTRTGLSTVVTTLIILVVGVLLASVVTYYATNVTMTRTEIEDVHFSKKHVWVNDTGAVASFKLQNLGGRDILLDKVVVRGVESHWSDIWIYRIPSGISIEADLNITSYAALTGDTVLITGINYTAATSDIPLISGGEIFVYVKGPGNIQMDDIGKTVSFGVYTSNAQYITECNVESATSQ